MHPGVTAPNMSESLKKRLEYLGIADMDYLSARILIINGMTHTGLSKGAEAFEKLFKLFLVLEAKIVRNEELSSLELKNYEHKLVKLFEEVVLKIPGATPFDKSWKDYFEQLQMAYKTRYPESWKEVKLINDLTNLDKAYCYFRNNITTNFPKEEQEKTKFFGTFILKAYNKDVVNFIVSQGGLSPKEAFLKSNNHSAEFNIELDKLPL